MVRRRSSRQVQTHHTWPRTGDLHQAIELFGGLTVESAEDQPSAAINAGKGRVDDGFGGGIGVQLRSKADLQGGHSLGRRVLADLSGHPADPLGSPQELQCESKARQGLRQAHPGKEGQVPGDFESLAGGKLLHRGGTQRTIQVPMQIGKGYSGLREAHVPTCR